MKKFFAIAFIAATLVACGGGETPAPEAGTATETTTAAPAEAAAPEAGTATPTTPQP